MAAVSRLALFVVAPLGHLLHWLESWLAHEMAYRLLAEMRIDLYVKLEALAPGLSARAAVGYLLALSTQDVETVEYFFAHTVAPAFVAALGRGAVLATLGALRGRSLSRSCPSWRYAGLSPWVGRRRIDRLGTEARAALGQIGAHVTETIQGLSDLLAFQANSGGVRSSGTHAAAIGRCALHCSMIFRGRTKDWSLRQVSAASRSRASGVYLAANHAIAPTLLPLLILISVAAFLPVSEISQVGRQLADTIASTRRLHVVHSEPVRIVDGPIDPPVHHRRLRRCNSSGALHLSTA